MKKELQLGYLFRYNNQTWKITEVYNIKWNDGTKSTEFKVKSNNNAVHYLEIETAKDKSKTYSFWTKETNKDFLFSDKPLTNYVTLGSARFPKELNYNGVTYFYDETCTGTCNYGYETEQVDSLDYTNKNDTRLFSIELWDDEIEVSTGFPIKESDISNIQEGKPSLGSTSLEGFFSKYFSWILIGGFIVVSSLMKTCSSRNTWNNDNQYQNDSTKVNRSNSYYRGRSGGFGK